MKRIRHHHFSSALVGLLASAAVARAEPAAGTNVSQSQGYQAAATTADTAASNAKTIGALYAVSAATCTASCVGTSWMGDYGAAACSATSIGSNVAEGVITQNYAATVGTIITQYDNIEKIPGAAGALWGKMTGSGAVAGGATTGAATANGAGAAGGAAGGANAGSGAANGAAGGTQAASNGSKFNKASCIGAALNAVQSASNFNTAQNAQDAEDAALSQLDKLASAPDAPAPLMPAPAITSAGVIPNGALPNVEIDTAEDPSFPRLPGARLPSVGGSASGSDNQALTGKASVGSASGSDNAALNSGGSRRCSDAGSASEIVKCARRLDPNLPAALESPGFAKAFQQATGMGLDQFLKKDFAPSMGAGLVGQMMGGAAGFSAGKTAAISEKLKEYQDSLHSLEAASAYSRGGGGGGSPGAGAGNEFMALTDMLKGLNGQGEKANAAASLESKVFPAGRAPATAGRDLTEDTSVSLFDRVTRRYAALFR